MKTVGYVRVSTDKQGLSLEAQAEKIRTGRNHRRMRVRQNLNRPGMAKLLAIADAGNVKAVFVAKLDRLTRSVRDLCELLERFERRGVALVSAAESLDTGRGSRQKRA
jgi:site-specific DNA recombinase